MEIQNKQIVERISDDAKIQQLEVPTTLNKTIQPVLISNPNKSINLAIANLKSTSGSSTLYTFHSTKATYVTGVYLSYEKDAACDATNVNIKLTVDGKQVNVALLPMNTGQIGGGSLVIPFKEPIKVTKGSTCVYNTSFAAGTCNHSAGFYAYEVDEI